MARTESEEKESLVRENRQLREALEGSVTPGKLADFTVLADKVCEANKETFCDIPVLATVVGGKVFKQG